MAAERTEGKAKRMVGRQYLRTDGKDGRMAAGRTGVSMAASRHKAAMLVAGSSVYSQ
jgi:hypothetical protein